MDVLYSHLICLRGNTTSCNATKSSNILLASCATTVVQLGNTKLPVSTYQLPFLAGDIFSFPPHATATRVDLQEESENIQN